MENIRYKKFLKHNQLKVNDIPEPIRDKIGVHNRLVKLLDKKPNDQKQEIIDTIDRYDLEILEDIEQHFEKELLHNDYMEIEVKQPKTVSPYTKIVKDLYDSEKRSGIKRSELTALGLPIDKNKDRYIFDNYRLERDSYLFYTYSIDLIETEK